MSYNLRPISPESEDSSDTSSSSSSVGLPAPEHSSRGLRTDDVFEDATPERQKRKNKTKRGSARATSGTTPSAPDPSVWQNIRSDWDARWRSTTEGDAWTPSPGQWETRHRTRDKARPWHNQLVAELDNLGFGSGQAWLQRKTAGEELVQIVKEETLGDVAVARRSSKPIDRQRVALRAILLLCEEEENPTNMMKLPKRGESAFPYGSSHTSHLLMMLFMLHVDRTLFLESIVSGVLKGGIEYGYRGIIFLASSIPDFFTRVDPAFVKEYAMRAVNNASCMSLRRFQGIELLYCIYRHCPRIKHGKSTILSVGRSIIESTMELCAKHHLDSVHILRAIVQTCWFAKKKGILPSILPSSLEVRRSTVGPLFPAQWNKPEVAITYNKLKPKLIALLVDQLHIVFHWDQFGQPSRDSQNRPIDQMQCLGNVCMQILVDRSISTDSREEPLGLDELIPLDIDAHAFEILCKLPYKIFHDALEAILDDGPSSRPPGNRLDLLLWLSITEAHKVLITGKACGFLGQILTDPESSTRRSQDKTTWHHKSKAMTCLGNIIGSMDDVELELYIDEVDAHPMRHLGSRGPTSPVVLGWKDKCGQFSPANQAGFHHLVRTSPTTSVAQAQALPFSCPIAPPPD
ncbi:hypothetical protein FS837_010376 [Tulasnella sp. UAMH 9824]|nr:hypothetical protein FS837_010376 [Tulasnella sp. UAMH 9824]